MHHYDETDRVGSHMPFSEIATGEASMSDKRVFLFYSIPPQSDRTMALAPVGWRGPSFLLACPPGEGPILCLVTNRGERVLGRAHDQCRRLLIRHPEQQHLPAHCLLHRSPEPPL